MSRQWEKKNIAPCGSFPDEQNSLQVGHQKVCAQGFCNRHLLTYVTSNLWCVREQFKRTLTEMGEVKQEDIDKTKEDLETIFNIFKHYVKRNRPSLDIEAVATGEVADICIPSWLAVHPFLFMLDVPDNHSCELQTSARRCGSDRTLWSEDSAMTS